MVAAETWTFGSSLRVENPSVGRFSTLGLYTFIELNKNQHNWLVCSVPAPSVLEGWRIKSVYIQYRILGQFGLIDKVGVRDGKDTYYSFDNLSVGPTSTTWWFLDLELPNTLPPYKYGIGVTIHVNYPDHPGLPPPTRFQFTSIGLFLYKPD
jgi:hypothetical protein